MRSPVLRSASLATGSVLLALVSTIPLAAAAADASAAGPLSTPNANAGVQRHDNQGPGRWTVAPVGPAQFRVTWHSPTVIPTTDAPVQVLHKGALTTASVGAAARTVSIVVSSSTPPDPSTFDVMLGSTFLDRRVHNVNRSGGNATPYRVPSTKALLNDPGTPGTHAITSSDYQLAPVKLPDIKQLSEMVGHVVAPVDATDASPFVLFLHGRHDPCYSPKRSHEPGSPSPEPASAADVKVWSCGKGEKPVPSYLGYDYVQRLLASQGYVTVSISADAINALDYNAIDGGAAARAELIRDHLRAWVGFVDDGTQQADLSNTVLVGHSRGGEGVNRASLNLPTNEGYGITGQVLIGPTDFAFQAAPATPTVTLLPYCDGDVSDLQGQNFTDDGRDVPADSSTDLAFHSSVMVMGANHNFFNTEWTPGISAAPSFDDWGEPRDATCGTKSPNRLNATQQRKVGKAYIDGAVQLFASDDDSLLPMFDGSPVSVPSTGSADVRSHAIGGGLVTMRPGLDGSASAGATADVRLCDGVSDSKSIESCQKKVSSVKTPHWPSGQLTGVPYREFLETSWRSAGLQGGLDLDNRWDLSDDTRLDLRTIVDPDTGPVRVGVTLTDSHGNSAVVTPVGGGNLYPLPGDSYSLAKRWGQDLRVSLGGVSGVDLSRITQVGLTSLNASGRVFLVDVSATPDVGVSANPTTATPVLSIDTVKQAEGNGTDPVTADVSWHVTGDLNTDAVVSILHSTPFSFDPKAETETLVIPAHTSSGVLHVDYKPNDLDDRGTRFIGLTAYPISGVETDEYVGGAVIVDDDPTPNMTVRGTDRRITYGQDASWTATLAKPVNYYAVAIGKPVKAVDGPQLRVGDLPKSYRNSMFSDPHPDLDTPLYKTDIRFWVVIKPHRLSGKISLPTRHHDGVSRAISLKFHARGVPIAHPISTVRVGS